MASTVTDEKRSAQGPQGRALDAEGRRPQPPEGEHPGQRKVHQDAQGACDHDDPRPTDADEVSRQHALEEEQQGSAHEDAEVGELQLDLPRAVPRQDEAAVHHRDQRQENGKEHHGKHQSLRDHLQAAVRAPRTVVLGGDCVHVAHDAGEQRREHELREPAAHGSGDVARAEERHEVAVEEEHDRLRGRGGDHGEGDGKHAAKGDFAVVRDHPPWSRSPGYSFFVHSGQMP